jgi:DNA-directed RNA polymerase specialized sigma24 family protein
MPNPTPIDARLREAARAGDPAAFEQLVAPHRADLHRYCTLMLGCPIQGVNLMHATICEARSELASPDLDACSSTRVWLHRIATRACMRRLSQTDR